MSDSQRKRLEELTELTQNSLVKVQYSCCGLNSSIDEPEDIPIVPEKRIQATRFKYVVATDTSIDLIKVLLAEVGLPVSDLAQGERTFLLSMNGDEIVGCVAVEKYGEAGLLRSLAVKPYWQGNNVGKTLLDEAEAWAVTNDIGQLYLLTITAEGYFSSLNWETADRAAVPLAIAATSEFATLCPESAVCFTKGLM